MVREGGLEPPRLGQQLLRLPCLPISPFPHPQVYSNEFRLNTQESSCFRENSEAVQENFTYILYNIIVERQIS